MDRSFAQAAAFVFAVVGIAGFFTGDAGTVANGQAGGNFDGVALHLTYARDVVDLVLAAAFAYAGLRAGRSLGRTIVLAAGGLLLLLAIVGFVVGDTVDGQQSIASLHFPLATNIFDLVAGTLAVLCGLGGLDDRTAAAPA